MTNSVHQAAHEALLATRRLHSVLPASSILAVAAATLADRCLELVRNPHGWTSAHELGRDLRAHEHRERALEDSAASLALSARMIQRLAIHAGNAHPAASTGEALIQLASQLVGSIDALDALETEIAGRIAEPRLSQIDLEARRDRLRERPAPDLESVRHLSREIEVLRRREESSHAEQRQLLDEHSEARRKAEQAEALRSKLEVAISEAKRRHGVALDECERLRREYAALESHLREGEESLIRTRAALRALHADPRMKLREAIERALRELPPDSNDSSPGART